MKAGLLIAALCLSFAGCGSSSKSKKAPVVEVTEPTETVEAEEQPTETEEPTDETAQKEPIDLGLEGSSNGEVTITQGDFVEDTIGGCKRTDQKCLKRLMETKLKEAKAKCGKDEACLQKAALEEAGKMGIQIDDGQIVVDVPK